VGWDEQSTVAIRWQISLPLFIHMFDLLRFVMGGESNARLTTLSTNNAALEGLLARIE